MWLFTQYRTLKIIVQCALELDHLSLQREREREREIGREEGEQDREIREGGMEG